jgi:hypothetical protein
MSPPTTFLNSPAQVGFIDAMIDEDEVHIPSTEDVTAEASGSSSSCQRRPSPKDLSPEMRMSKVSELYDHDHKGYLDSTEIALRRMDSENQGHLDNSKVYEIMKSLQLEQQKSAALIDSLQKEHKKAMSLKRGIIYMSFFAFLLALSNIGTSFVAARLAKDVTTDSGDLVSTNSGARVATTPKNMVLKINPITTINGDDATRNRHARLAELACGEEYLADYNNSEWDTNSTAQPTVSCEAIGRIDYQDAVDLYKVFCPEYPFPEGTADPSACSNFGLSEVLLQCGTRLTRLLGGPNFPMGGVPAQDGNVSFVSSQKVGQLYSYVLVSVSPPISSLYILNSLLSSPHRLSRLSTPLPAPFTFKPSN